MDKILLLRPFIKMISEGKFFALFFSWVLRIQAALMVLGFLYGSFQMWSMMRGGVTFGLFVGLVIGQLLFAVLAFVLINILLVRADDINNLPLSTDYFVMPIIVIFVKMTGEIIGVFYAIMGIILGFGIWIMGGSGVVPSIPGMGMFAGNSGFLGGLIAIVGGPVLGFLLLSLFYFIGEQIGALVDIARNTKR